MHQLPHIEKALGIRYPRLFHDFLSFIEGKKEVRYENYFHGYFDKFRFLDFYNPDINRYIGKTEMYEGDPLDPVNIFFQTRLFFNGVPFHNEIPPNARLLPGETLLPIAVDTDNDGTLHLYISNIVSPVYLINIGWADSPRLEIAPDLSSLLAEKNGEFAMTDEGNYYLLDSHRRVKEYYLAKEKRQYGELLGMDLEGYEDLNNYRHFFRDLFEKFRQVNMLLEDFAADETACQLLLTINGRSIRIPVTMNGDWFDENVITELNKALADTLNGRQFIIIRDSKFVDQTISIALVPSA